MHKKNRVHKERARRANRTGAHFGRLGGFGKKARPGASAAPPLERRAPGGKNIFVSPLERHAPVFDVSSDVDGGDD